MINIFKGQYEFLSNFYPYSFNYMGYYCKTSEHIYQALKTNEEAERLIVLNAKTPGNAKRLGQTLTIVDNWNEIRQDVMYDILKAKFQGELKQKLLDTGTKELIEGNLHHDNYWGDCICHRCQYINGKNNLGKLLMKLRKEIGG